MVKPINKPFNLNPTQQALLKELIDDYVVPRTQELITVAQVNDNDLFTSHQRDPRMISLGMRHYNLYCILNLLSSITRNVGIVTFKKSIENLFSTIYEASKPDHLAPTFIQTILALHHLATNTANPLTGTLAETICDPKLFTTTPKLTAAKIIHLSLVVISSSVRAAIQKCICDTLKTISHEEPQPPSTAIKPSLTIS